MGDQDLFCIFLVTDFRSRELVLLGVLPNALGSSEVLRSGGNRTRWAIPSNWCIAVAAFDECTHVAAL